MTTSALVRERLVLSALLFDPRKKSGLVDEDAAAYTAHDLVESVFLSIENQVAQAASRRPSVVVVPIRNGDQAGGM